MATIVEEIQVINGPALETRITNPAKSSRQVGIEGDDVAPALSTSSRQFHAFDQNEVQTGAVPLQASKARTIATIIALTAMTFTSSMSTGLITIGITRIAADLQLPSNLLLWYLIHPMPPHY